MGNYDDILIELPDLSSPGAWSRKYKDRLDRSVIELNNCKALSDKLNELCNTSKRNRYFWGLSTALYNLQFTTPEMLLALKECDSVDANSQKAGRENVKKAIMDFKQAWMELEEVYGQTRFVSYPASYIPDRYFHLASQSEDLTWMIQHDNLFIGMIEKWLQNQPN